MAACDSASGWGLNGALPPGPIDTTIAIVGSIERRDDGHIPRFIEEHGAAGTNPAPAQSNPRLVMQGGERGALV